MYFYDGNKRASESTSRDGMERSVVFQGNALLEVSLLDGEGNFDIERVIDFLSIKTNISLKTICGLRFLYIQVFHKDVHYVH